MKKNEKELFFELCSFKKQNKEKLNKLLSEAATPTVLGQLFFNRMQGIAFGVLKENNLLNCVNREFRNSLQLAYQQNKKKNESFFHCIRLLTEILKPHKGKYAMLKGALLCAMYPDGYRTSNDVDLLVRPSDVTDIGNTLTSAGFRQGSIVNGEFKQATRREIIESKMTRGETVPYILEINLPYMKFLEVDINFSLDYKNSDIVELENLIDRTTEMTINSIKINTLQKNDFLIHLCGHLYKEASTFPWVKMKRDMTFYKFCDIYMMLSELTPLEIDAFFKRAEELSMKDICSCVIAWTCQLISIESDYALNLALDNLKVKENILYEVIDPSEHKVLQYYEPDIKKRFFCNDRTALLREVIR